MIPSAFEFWKALSEAVPGPHRLLSRGPLSYLCNHASPSVLCQARFPIKDAIQSASERRPPARRRCRTHSEHSPMKSHDPRSTRSSVIGLLLWLALAFTAAAVGSFFTPGEWYSELQKPAWNPPRWIFAPVWTALYATMGIAAWLIWNRTGLPGRGRALALFLLQLALNAMWSPIFFGLQNPALAFVNIMLLWLALLATVAAFWKMRWPAGALLLPYLAWVTFAAGLNFVIWGLNP